MEKKQDHLDMQYLKYEKRLSDFLKGKSSLLLRWAMGIVYLWYGILKVLGNSPVEEFVMGATHWTSSHGFVIFLGVWEILIGLFLLTKKCQRIGLFLLFIQFPGTFLPLFTNPEACFTSIPFGLTLEGQYIFKNLVLIAVGLYLISTLHPKNENPS